jgi:hypothetical protein
MKKYFVDCVSEVFHIFFPFLLLQEDLERKVHLDVVLILLHLRGFLVEVAVEVQLQLLQVFVI